MRVIGDRFAVDGSGRALDLATGEAVMLSFARAGNVAEQRQWLYRCDELHRLRHPSVAVLVDYGLIGETHRFEAWWCGGPWHGSPDVAHHAACAASGFLRAIGMTCSQNVDLRIHRPSRAPVIVPAREAGYRACEADKPTEWTGELPPGLLLVDRPLVTRLAEMIRLASQSRPRIATLWGPPGSGRTTAILTLARVARTNGFVPIDSRLLAGHRSALVGHSLFVIERSDARSTWAAWLLATLQSPRPHVCLVVGVDEVRGVDGVPLERLRPEELLSVVQPAGAREVASIRRAAVHARGLPGRFVRSLWPIPLERRIGPSTTLPRAAEQPAVYGEEVGPAPQSTLVTDGAGVPGWPLPGELAGLRRKVEEATALINQGRHAPGVRQLRQAVGALARRDAWFDATLGSLHLASGLLRRGRARDAQGVLGDAGDYATRAGDAGALLDLAILTGESWIDMARLEEAQRVFSAALASARAAGDRPRTARAALGLGRCLFWRARYADADATLRGSTCHPDSADEIRRLRLMARNAVALRDPSTAMSALIDARGRAAAAPGTRLVADVEHTSASVHLMVGDLDAVDRDAAAFVEATRGRHHPTRAFSTRLLQAEADRRRGRTPPRGALQALRRRAGTMPPILKKRWDLFAALAASGLRKNEAPVERLVSASGLPALSLFTKPVNRLFGNELAPDELAPDRAVDEIVEILHLCQTADDEPAVLKQVCARVRRHLDAVSVAFVAAAPPRLHAIAFDGPRMELEIAERAMAAAITIAPHQYQGRVEAAAVVQYGGRVIGALGARWTLGSTGDLSRASAVLSTAAAAAAPMLWAALVAPAAREPSATLNAVELLGVTPAMAELRRAVERAASAPFAVLIEGESGAGKELVARAIHRSGPRHERAFCTLNCAALPDDLVEAELFGHARGSFTGALTERAGIFEEAHNGTLFLDEVGELSGRAQAKLLRIMQDGELRRIGENVARRVDVRIVSATNRDLGREVEAGRFRLDLLYRLDVIRISVPPLRERYEDIALLVDHFWIETTRRISSRAILSAAARTALASYHWPGNVRELQNVLASLAVRSPKRGAVPVTALPPQFAPRGGQEGWRLDAARRTFDESFVRAALVRAGGHRGRAAAELGLTRQGLTKLMGRLGIRHDHKLPTTN